MDVTTALISELQPAPHNPRKISQRMMESLKRSIQEFKVWLMLLSETKAGRGLGQGPPYPDARRSRRAPPVDMAVAPRPDPGVRRREARSVHRRLPRRAVPGARRHARRASRVAPRWGQEKRRWRSEESARAQEDQSEQRGGDAVT